MKKITLITILLFANIVSNAQVRGLGTNIWAAKEFSKDIALYKSKNFLFSSVIGTSENVTQFEIIPLAAASSGELTTLLYRCEAKNEEGIILGFYGDYWNDAGVVFQGYGFKNLGKDEAIEFLTKIQKNIEENSKFLKSNDDKNNIVFKYKDIEVMVWTYGASYTIRLFWNNFDSTWESTAFERSKRRFEKRLKPKNQ